MGGFWLRALDRAEKAEMQARDLRNRFGGDAEARCAEELRSFAPEDPRRERVEDIRRALRWT